MQRCCERLRETEECLGQGAIFGLQVCHSFRPPYRTNYFSHRSFHFPRQKRHHRNEGRHMLCRVAIHPNRLASQSVNPDPLGLRCLK